MNRFLIPIIHFQVPFFLILGHSNKLKIDTYLNRNQHRKFFNITNKKCSFFDRALNCGGEKGHPATSKISCKNIDDLWGGLS